MGFIAGTLTGGGIAAAFVATLIGQDSTGLYIICAAISAAGLLLMLLHIARRGQDAAPWYALAPMAVVVTLLGIAASGATCGVACIAWGSPVAGVLLVVPDIRGWFSRKRPLKRV